LNFREKQAGPARFVNHKTARSALDGLDPKTATTGSDIRPDCRGIGAYRVALAPGRHIC
jgi:hypothetical protein